MPVSAIIVFCAGQVDEVPCTLPHAHARIPTVFYSHDQKGGGGGCVFAYAAQRMCRSKRERVVESKVRKGTVMGRWTRSEHVVDSKVVLLCDSTSVFCWALTRRWQLSVSGFWPAVELCGHSLCTLLCKCRKEWMFGLLHFKLSRLAYNHTPLTLF